MKNPGLKPGFIDQITNYSASMFELDSALDFAGTQASCADFDMGGCTVNNGTDTLEVGFPGALGANVGVADVHSRRNSFAANSTYISHDYYLLYTLK